MILEVLRLRAAPPLPTGAALRMTTFFFEGRLRRSLPAKGVAASEGELFCVERIEQPGSFVLLGAADGGGVERKFRLERGRAHVAETQRDEAQGLAAFPCAAEQCGEARVDVGLE